MRREKKKESIVLTDDRLSLIRDFSCMIIEILQIIPSISRYTSFNHFIIVLNNLIGIIIEQSFLNLSLRIIVTSGIRKEKLRIKDSPLSKLYLVTFIDIFQTFYDMESASSPL